MRFPQFKSFATRLTFSVITFVMIIFSIIIVIFYTFSRKEIIEQAITHTHDLLDNMADHVNIQLTTVEVALKNTAWMVDRNKSTPDSLLSILLQVVHNNPLIMGCGIAFEPNYYPDKGEYYLLYAEKKNNKITYVRLGGPDYNYFGMDWYLIPKLLKRSYWSEPYYDEGGGNTTMSTFSYPLYNEKGEVYAMLTADISLIQFANMVGNLKIYDSSYSFLLSRNGYYLTHPESERIMKETIFSYAFEHNNLVYGQIGGEMIDGKTGTKFFLDNGEYSYAFYTSIPQVGWSICNVVPKDIILSELNIISRNILIIFFIGSLLLFFGIFYFIRRVVLPLEGFTKSAFEIATGKFDVQLPHIKSKDEMSSLYESFVYMQKSLAKYIEELKQTTAVNERMDSELCIAREIQMGMIPKAFPQCPDIDLYAVLKPAKEVGGDLYDFFIQDAKLYFIVGDVSGKGIPASLFMAITKSLFHTIAIPGMSSQQIVTRLNESIVYSNETGMFVTLFVGILDLYTGKLSYCNAGHSTPILVHPDGKVEYMVIKSNLVVGVIQGFDYIGEEVQLTRGSKLLLYTDGVIDAIGVDQQLYSEERLLAIITSHSDLDVKSLIELVEQSVVAYEGDTDQNDDMTLLAINYKMR